MNEVDISVLNKKPELTEKVVLEIEPLAPLSMVKDLPGSFYKSLKSPSKKMLCGLFENILEWHFSYNDRTAIQKEIIKVREKQKIEYIKPQTGSTYIPLLMEYFDIDLVIVYSFFMYNDLWSRAYRRADADVHPKGTQNIHYELIPIKRNRPRDRKKPKQIDSKELFMLFKENVGKFPLYYSTPTSREYIQYSNSIQFTLTVDTFLFECLKIAISKNNKCYVGNSEGWVNLKIERYENK